MIRYLVGLFAALLFAPMAQAVDKVTEYGLNNVWGSAASVCAAYATYASSQHATLNYTVNSSTPPSCVLNNIRKSTGLPNGQTTTVSYSTRLACPENSTGTDTCTCNSGFSDVGGVCVPGSPECEVGQGRTFNRTAGWARSPKADADDIVDFYGPPSSNYDYNDGTCVGDLTGIDQCWRSQEPSAQGLYRLSCDHTMVISGPSTSAGDANADPTTDNATCPGFVGQVNGKPVCVGTASSPLPAPVAAPDVPTGAGNPSAGPKPATGPGSGSNGAGRTPADGTGGNDGGPASAAVGAGGTGPRSDGTEPTGEVCGAAPLPPCNVKVDETGTPNEASAPGRFTQGNTDLDKVKTDANDAFGDHRDIQLPAWTWTFQFPTGCTPLVLGGYDDFEIDVCQFQPMIHDLMSVLWVIAGIWGMIALFQRATGT